MTNFIKLLAAIPQAPEVVYMRKDSVVVFQSVDLQHIEFLKKKGVENPSDVRLIICEHDLSGGRGSNSMLVRNTFEQLEKELLSEEIPCQ